MPRREEADHRQHDRRQKAQHRDRLHDVERRDHQRLDPLVVRGGVAVRDREDQAQHIGEKDPHHRIERIERQRPRRERHHHLFRRRSSPRTCRSAPRRKSTRRPITATHRSSTNGQLRRSACERARSSWPGVFENGGMPLNWGSLIAGYSSLSRPASSVSVSWCRRSDCVNLRRAASKSNSSA